MTTIEIVTPEKPPLQPKRPSEMSHSTQAGREEKLASLRGVFHVRRAPAERFFFLEGSLDA
jgi:hypothetical protein